MKRQVKKKASRVRTFWKVLGIFIVSALICFATYGIYLAKQAENALNDSYESDSRDGSDMRDEKVTPIEDNVSILFVGIDDSELRGQGADHSRSDALILATLNVETKTIKTLSIPRDSYVYIPYKKRKDKITHAHAYGGTLATIETVENLLDIPVDYYVRMNFDAFIDVVDALGGITADVPYDLLELDENENFSVNLKKGTQKLNGSEALALARTRKQDNDIERGKRQQEILKAIAVQAAKPTSILKYDDVINAVSKNMKTNMTFGEMKSFLSYLSNGAPRIDSVYLDGTDDMSTGVYYYQLDEESLEDAKSILKRHLGIESGTTSSTDSSSND